jgi:hypothetical protein
VLAPATLAAFPSTRAIETRSLPGSLAATYRGFAFYVAHPIRSIETRSLPGSLAATHRGFAFYVAHSIRSIRRGECKKRSNLDKMLRARAR